jgi:transposase
MLGMLKRHEIKVLLKAGHAQTEVARLAGVSLRSVKRVAKEGDIDHVDDAAERRKRGIGRPSVVEDFRKSIVDLLEKEADIKSVEVLRRMRLEGYTGQKTALFALVAGIRPKDCKPLVRFEGLPGEFSQHDFGQVDVEYLDGSTQRIRFFASRLKYSRTIRVSVVPDETAETLIRNFAEHLHSWGGAPLMSIFDRPKTIALKWQRDGVVTEWNPTFAYAVVELGVGVDVCWPYRPQEKGSVENLVGFVKGSFFKQRRFHDLADLLAQLAAWHHEVNDERPCRASGVTPSARLVEELRRLRPLKVLPENLALRLPIYIGPTGTVVHDTHPYSMPPEAIGISGTLYLYRDRVRIVAGRFDVTHDRKFKPGEGSTLPDHRAALVAAVAGKRAKRYLKRQQLLDLGEPALAYLTEIVHRRPKDWIRDVDQLHELLQLHGPDRLRGAFEYGLQVQVFGAPHVERALQLPGPLFAEGLLQ